jgi:hypothetical protein
MGLDNVTHYRVLCFKEGSMAHRTVSSLLIVASFFLSACKDKAEPDYAKCVQADTAGDIDGAWTACNAAVAADPNSTSAKAAVAKLAELKPKYDARQAKLGATADKGAKANGADDEIDPEDKDRMATRADRKHARAEQRADQTQAALAGTQAACGSIQHDPALAAIFSIESATSSDSRACDVIVQAKTPITRQLVFNWLFYDKDGVKLGDARGHINGLGVGDKQKLLIPFGAIVGTGVAKIVSKPE